MKRFITLLLVMSLAAIVSAKDVKIGVFLHFPNVYQETGSTELKGADIRYLNDVFKEMGYTPVYVVLPISRLLATLQSGEVDIAGILLKTPEREAIANFPDTPTVILQPSLFFLTENKLNKINSIDDLKGMTIGYIPTSPIPKFLDAPDKVKFDLLGADNWVEMNLKKLLAGRVDAVLDQNPYSFVAEAKKTGIQSKLKVLPLPVEGTKGYMLFSKKSALGSELLAAYNKILAGKKYNFDKYMNDEVK